MVKLIVRNSLANWPRVRCKPDDWLSTLQWEPWLDLHARIDPACTVHGKPEKTNANRSIAVVQTGWQGCVCHVSAVSFPESGRPFSETGAGSPQPSQLLSYCPSVLKFYSQHLVGLGVVSLISLLFLSICSALIVIINPEVNLFLSLLVLMVPWWFNVTTYSFSL